MTNRTKLTFAVILVAVAGFGLTRYLPSPVPSAAPPAAAAVPVVTAQVEQGEVPILISGIGTVQALNTAVIRSQVTGLLTSVTFTEGKKVKKGEVLAQIDPRPQRAALQQAQAQLGRDQTHLANAQVNLNRNVPLLTKGFATEQSVTDQQSAVSQLQNDVRSDEAAVDNAQTQLSYTSLVAPFDGVTGVRTMDEGNIIHPTDANGLVTVTQVQPIAVLMTLPSGDITRVQEALNAGPVGATAYDQAGTKQLDQGTLLLINNQADPASGTVQLKALFQNPKRLLWPGTFVNVELTVSTVAAGLTIPLDALQQGAKGPFVYVVDAGNKVAVQQVRVAERAHGRALVSEGLQANQTVVEQGQYRLVDGTVVTASKPSEVADVTSASSGLLP